MPDLLQQLFPHLAGQLRLGDTAPVLGDLIVLLSLPQLPLEDPQLFPEEIVPLAGGHLLVHLGRQLALYL